MSGTKISCCQIVQIPLQLYNQDIIDNYVKIINKMKKQRELDRIKDICDFFHKYFGHNLAQTGHVM